LLGLAALSAEVQSQSLQTQAARLDFFGCGSATTKAPSFVPFLFAMTKAFERGSE